MDPPDPFLSLVRRLRCSRWDFPRSADGFPRWLGSKGTDPLLGIPLHDDLFIRDSHEPRCPPFDRDFHVGGGPPNLGGTSLGLGAS